MPKDIKSRFGAKLGVIRRDAGFTQEELAHATKLDRGYISNVENGRVNISLENIALLAKALKVTIPALMPDR